MSDQLTALLGELEELADDLDMEAKDRHRDGLDPSSHREIRDKLRRMVKRYRKVVGP